MTAEIGVAWQGDIGLAGSLVREARLHGADAAKFQAFLPEHVEDKELLKSAVTRENVSQLREKADLADIEFYCTPFYPEAVDFLDPHVKRYKIRERDSREILQKGESPLLNRVLDTGKLVFISAAYKPIAPLFLRYHPSIAWLYVVPKYPPKIEEVNLTMCKGMEGYSNHFPARSVVFSAAVMAALSGQKEFFLEVHVGEGPDKKVSLTFAELKRLVRDLRLLEKMNFNLVGTQ